VVADEWINPVVDVGKGKLRTMLGRMNRGTSSESRSTGRIRTRPNNEARECGDGIQKMEFFGERGERRMRNMVDIL
jgi:hypothetical protein